MINDGGIALDSPVNGQIASKPGIGDFSVFQYLDGSFNAVDSWSTQFE